MAPFEWPVTNTRAGSTSWVRLISSMSRETKATSSTPCFWAGPQHRPAFQVRNRSLLRPMPMPSGYTTRNPLASARRSKPLLASNWVPQPTPPCSPISSGTGPSVGSVEGT